MNLNKKWKVFLIHHSHTDIGYTEHQERIAEYHRNYIEQAIDILNTAHSSDDKGYKGFVWQCENYWQVENFLKYADENYKKDFEKYIKSGEIGLSGNYLNMTELADNDCLNVKAHAFREYCNKYGILGNCGMSADINGFAWGYADAMYENGITHFFSCLHPHHGMFPLYRKQIPFYWVSPKGNKVLVWNGEHYHIGNELHFAPRGGTSYMINDELGEYAYKALSEPISYQQREEIENHVLDVRLYRYLKNLEDEKYSYDFIPFMVSGAITDNAPPSGEIARRVNELNEKYSGQIELEMTNLEKFFEYVEQNCKNIPEYSGDWNDWWADGVGSTPAAVKLYKDAQRKYHICRKIDADNTLGDSELLKSVQDNLMLYAEHTWGYSSSVSEPWETLVDTLDLKKTAYAVNAHTAAAANLDRILRSKGEVTSRCQREMRYRVVNPHDVPVTSPVNFFIETWEYFGDEMFTKSSSFDIIDLKTNESVKYQLSRTARAYQVEITATLEPKEERDFLIIKRQREYDSTIKNHPYIGADGIMDICANDGQREDTRRIDTDFFVFNFDTKKGITSIIDKNSGRDIVRRDSEYTPFAGVYEVTDIKDHPCETRRIMGRNRKLECTRRYKAEFENIRIVESGDIFIHLAIDYALDGTRMYTVMLKIYRHLPRFDVSVRIHKESRWEPENLYIPLTFTAGEDSECYIDKTGCIIRPGIDQLPGSNGEFYLLQNGIVMCGDDINVNVAIKDAPLVTFGELEHHPIKLCDANDLSLNRSEAFSWVMNNFWETNFKVDLSGFYEFRYSVEVTQAQSAQNALKNVENCNEEPIVYSV